jgi:hypothetical protein
LDRQDSTDPIGPGRVGISLYIQKFKKKEGYLPPVVFGQSCKVNFLVVDPPVVFVDLSVSFRRRKGLGFFC